MTALDITPEVLRSVSLRAEFRTDRVPTDKKRIVLFDWTCESSVTTDEKAYLGRFDGGEERFVCLPADPDGRLLVTAHRASKVRIISFRMASRAERRRYEDSDA